MINEERFEKLEKQMNTLRQRIEEVGRRAGDKIDEKLEHIPRRQTRRGNRDSLFWGIALIVVGAVWMGKSFGMFFWGPPLLPTVLIVLGLFLIFRTRKNRS